MFLTKGGWQNFKTLIIHDTLQLTMEPLHIMLSKLKWLSAIGRAVPLIAVDCILLPYLTACLEKD